MRTAALQHVLLLARRSLCARRGLQCSSSQALHAAAQEADACSASDSDDRCHELVIPFALRVHGHGASLPSGAGPSHDGSTHSPADTQGPSQWQPPPHARAAEQQSVLQHARTRQRRQDTVASAPEPASLSQRSELYMRRQQLAKASQEVVQIVRQRSQAPDATAASAVVQALWQQLLHMAEVYARMAELSWRFHRGGGAASASAASSATAAEGLAAPWLPPPAPRPQFGSLLEGARGMATGAVATAAAPAAALPLLPPRLPAAQVLAAAAGGCQRRVAFAVGAAMGVAVKNSDAGAMADLWRYLGALRVAPSQEHYLQAMHLARRKGATPEALEDVLAEMLAFGVLPSITHYGPLIEAYGAAGQPAAAARALDRAEAAGLVPELDTYARLLHGLAASGDLEGAQRAYRRMRAAGVTPDARVMARLFRVAAAHAQRARLAGARRMAASPAAARDSALRRRLLGERDSALAAAYDTLAGWQRDMVALGIRHSDVSLHHLLTALERLNMLPDCVELSQLFEKLRPGAFAPHRAALRISSRRRSVESASYAHHLGERLAAGGRLERSDFAALLCAQFWIHRDVEQVQETLAAMQAQGVPLDAAMAQQLVHLYCDAALWSQALAALDRLAAAAPPPGEGAAQPGEGGASARTVARRRRPASAEGYGVHSDSLWHLVWRQLLHRQAPDAIVTEFARRMRPQQLQRFQVMYGALRRRRDGSFSVGPVQDEEDED